MIKYNISHFFKGRSVLYCQNVKLITKSKKPDIENKFQKWASIIGQMKQKLKKRAREHEHAFKKSKTLSNLNILMKHILDIKDTFNFLTKVSHNL